MVLLAASVLVLTNGAAMPSFTYNIDYIDIDEGIKKTGTFVKFFSGPDIIFQLQICLTGWIPIICTACR